MKPDRKSFIRLVPCRPRCTRGRPWFRCRAGSFAEEVQRRLSTASRCPKVISAKRFFIVRRGRRGRFGRIFVQGILNGEVSLYSWPPVWLVWNHLYDYWQFLLLMQNRLIQTSQKGGKWYSDTSPLIIPWFVPGLPQQLGLTSGRIFSRVWSLCERAVSNLDRSRSFTARS